MTHTIKFNQTKMDELENDLLDMAYEIDKLHQLLALVVSLLETRLIDDVDIKNILIDKIQLSITPYYQAALPFDQYLKLNKQKVKK
jgi:hypothetical protein